MAGKFRKGLAGLLLAVAPIGLSGCQHPSDTAALGILGMGVGAGAGSVGVFAGGVGATTYAAGQAQGQRYSVNEQPVEQRQRVDQFLRNMEQNASSQQFYFFASDLQQRQVRERFRQTEGFLLVADLVTYRNEPVVLRVYIEHDGTSGPQPPMAEIQLPYNEDRNPRRIVTFEPNSFPPGVYIATWFDNRRNIPIGVKTISISP